MHGHLRCNVDGVYLKLSPARSLWASLLPFHLDEGDRPSSKPSVSLHVCIDHAPLQPRRLPIRKDFSYKMCTANKMKNKNISVWVVLQMPCGLPGAFSFSFLRVVLFSNFNPSYLTWQDISASLAEHTSSY